MVKSRFNLPVVLVLTVATGTAAQTWQTAPSFPAPRTYVNGLNSGGTLYAIGGTPWQNGGDADGAVHSRALNAPSWTPRMPLGGVGPVIHQGAAIDSLGRIIIFGGVIEGGADPGANMVYDPLEGPTISIAGRSNQAPDDNFAFCVDEDGLVYSIGGGDGEDAAPGNPNSTRVERYNAASDAWTVRAPLPAGIANAAATADGRGHVLVFGGINADGTARSSQVLSYDIAANSWSASAVPDMPAALSHARAVLGADERVYVVGGVTGPIGNGTIVDTVYKLDLHANSWSTGPSLAVARREFGAVLGDDDTIYVLGGQTPGGDTATSELLYTPPCPRFTEHPRATAARVGLNVGLTATATGGGVVTLRWRKDGVELTDGPTGSGSTISGAATDWLVITAPTAADAGTYDIVASNVCGTTASTAATLTVEPWPQLPTSWASVNLHPAWAVASYGRGVSGGTQVGNGVVLLDLFGNGQMYNIERPVIWTGSAASAVDVTPTGSVGGRLQAVKGNTQVGFWWWPYSCYFGGTWHTCYLAHAAVWHGSAASHSDAHMGGGTYEYSWFYDTDGTSHCGNMSSDSLSVAVVSGPLWNVVQPGGGTIAYAIDDTALYGGNGHAAMWVPSSGLIDLHPPLASYSYLRGAGDGLAVGYAYLSTVLSGRAVIASGAALSELAPLGTESTGLDAAGGFQVGALSGHAVIWAGPGSYVDLHPFLPAQFTSSSAAAIDIAADGTISVVGSAYNSTVDRSEAVWWHTVAVHPGDLNCDGVVDFDDISPFVLALSDPAGYTAAYPNCNVLNGDCNGDGFVDFNDINSFVTLLSQ